VNRAKQTRVIAAAGAVIVSQLALFNQAQASSFTWVSVTDNNIGSVATNWSPNGAPGTNDNVFFGALPGNASANATSPQTNFAVQWNSAVFNADSPAFTFGGTNTITIGTSANPPAGGTLTNNSAFTQTFNNPMAFRVGTINVANSDFVFNGAFNIGNNPNNNNLRNVTIIGSHNVTITGPITGTVPNSSTAPPAEDNGANTFGRLIMSGTGVLTLSGDSASTYTGRIVVNSGILRATVPNAFGANGQFFFNSGGGSVTAGFTHVSGAANTGRIELTGDNTYAPEVLVLEGRTVSDTQLSNLSGNNTWTGPVNIATFPNGGGSYAISSDGGNLTISGNITNTTGNNGIRTLALRGASNGIITGNIVEGSGSSNLSPFKDGAGTWVLTGSNNYTGTTTVHQGTLQIGNGGTTGNLGGGSVALSGGNLVFNRTDSTAVTGTLTGNGAVIIQTGTVGFSTGVTSGPSITVSDSAAMTLNGTGPTATMNIASLSVGGANGSTLTFSLGTGGNPTAPVISTAALARNGNNVVNLAGSNFSVGTFTLIQNTGAETGTGSFTLGTLPNRILASIFDTGSKVDLNITGIDFPKWTGAVNNNWDTSNNSNPKNWVLNSNGTTPTDYIEGDSVLFDDSSSVNGVNIPSDVSPNAITVNNSTKNYTFSGSGGIHGAATLTKTGPGTLIIANDGNNTFTGTISIGAGGTLQVGNGATNGSLGGGTLVNNGNLVLNRQSGVGLANNISGAGNLIVRANSVGTLSGNNSYDGVTTIESGAVLAANSATALGSANGNTVVQSGASLYVGAAGTFSYAEPITVSGTGAPQSAGAIHLTGSNTVTTFTGPITLAAPTTIVAESTSTGLFAGTLGGGFDLTVDGGGSVVLASDGNSYVNSIINSGTLQMGAGTTSGSIGTGTVFVGNTATFALNRSDLNSFGVSISGPGAVAVAANNGTFMFTNSNSFTGNVIMNRGILELTPGDLVGLGNGAKAVSALNRTTGIELGGNVSVPSSITFQLSNDGDLTQTGATVPFAVHGPAGQTNAINGEIDLTIGGGSSLMKVDAGGTLMLNGTISIVSGIGARTLGLGGAGIGIVNGVISNGPGANDVMNIGLNGNTDPNWILANANTCTGQVSLQAGTLTLMNNQALGLTSSGSFLGNNGTFCFIGNGAAAFANVSAALNIGTAGITVPNNLWTNRDGAGSLQTATAESTGRIIGFSGAGGTGTFSGTLLINGGAVFTSTPLGTLVMSGVLQNGTESFANGGRNDVFVNSAGTVVFSGSNTYTGFTQMNAGTLVLANAGAQSLVLTGPGTANGPGGADIRGGRMVFDYGASGSGDPLTTIRPLLQSALTNNFATGQLRVSNATPGIGIGYIDDTVGQRLQLLRTYLGDANTDGTVNALDFNALATNYGTTGNAVWAQGDFNYDGNVDTSDFVTLSTEFGQTLASPPAAVLGSLVPEPGVLSLSVGALLILRRRARRPVSLG
jgi:autotransporter-associated beta strand protein